MRFYLVKMKIHIKDRIWEGVTLAVQWPLFRRRRRQKWQLLKIFGKIGFSDRSLAPQAPKIWTNFGILVKNLTIFLKVEAFIAYWCLNWRRKSKKPFFIGNFSKFAQWQFFNNPVYSVTTPSVNPPPPSIQSLIHIVNSEKSANAIGLRFYHVIKYEICHRLVLVASL